MSGTVTVHVSPWNQATQGHASVNAVGAKAHANMSTTVASTSGYAVGKTYLGLENHDANTAWK